MQSCKSKPANKAPRSQSRTHRTHLKAPRIHLRAHRSRIKQTVATFKNSKRGSIVNEIRRRRPARCLRLIWPVPYPFLGYLTLAIHISRKREKERSLWEWWWLKKTQATDVKKISRKEEGRWAGRGYLYPANRAKICANPDSVMACEMEVNEQMGLQHSCQKLPWRSQQSWQ